MATILVVDDRPVNRQYLSTLLGYEGHRLLEAADGAEALEVARTEHPALVISDILMPTMDGVEFVGRMRAEAALAHIPVIFYTATYRVHEARVLAERCGVRHVLAKPADPEAVLKAVHEVLNLSGSSRVQGPAEPAREPTTLVVDVLRQHFADMQALNTEMSALIERGMEGVANAQSLVADRLMTSSHGLPALSLRLAAFVELGLDLAGERDVEHLLGLFSRAAHDILNARYVVLGVLDETGAVRHLFTRGMDAAAAARLRNVDPRSGLIARVLAADRPVRLRQPPGAAATTLLPSPQSAIRSFLGTRVRSGNTVYGWLYAADRMAAEEFDPEDEKLIVTLAAQLAVAYENVVLYEKVQQRAAVLGRDVAARTAELEAANKELEAFSYTVSHDLRAPLRAIDGFSKLLMENYADKLDEEGRRQLDHVRAGSKRMGLLIDDLLVLARVTRAELRPQEVDLSTLAESVAGELRREEPERRVEFTIVPGLRARGDARLLRIALENLLGNAWKYTRNQPQPRIELGVLADGVWSMADGQNREAGRGDGDHVPSAMSDMHVFFVRDNGAGFDMRYVDKLFRPFQRLHTDAQFEGTGIGLATVQRILHRHGGQVWAEGAVGQGATFYFSLTR